MTDEQVRAGAIFLDSATVDNDFKAISAEKISKQLKSEGMSVGSSTISRWKDKFNWDEELQQKIIAVGNDGSGKDIAPGSALDTSVKKTLVTVEKNQQLIAGSFDLLQSWLDQLNRNVANNMPITNDQIKIVTTIYQASSAREDKMLDRLANLGKEGGITPEQALEEISKAVTNFAFEDDIIDAEPA